MDNGAGWRNGRKEMEWRNEGRNGMEEWKIVVFSIILSFVFMTEQAEVSP